MLENIGLDISNKKSLQTYYNLMFSNMLDCPKRRGKGCGGRVSEFSYERGGVGKIGAINNTN